LLLQAFFIIFIVSMKITFISDTHNKHKQITSHLPGGDLLIHAGDITSRGYKHEIQEFLKWFNGLDNYTHKIFVAGNHDWGFQDDPEMCKKLLYFYSGVTYLQDNLELIEDDYQSTVRVYGSPWQPEFHNWAFNLPRNGDQLDQVWHQIPQDVDILVTHSPACGYLDCVIGQYDNLGCELLTERIREVKPKIHVCGHIHTGYGYIFNGDTHFINAAVLNEQYVYAQKPLSIEWNKEKNTVAFLD